MLMFRITEIAPSTSSIPQSLYVLQSNLVRTNTKVPAESESIFAVTITLEKICSAFLCQLNLPSDMASMSGAAEENEDERCKESRRLPGSGNTLMVTNKVVKDEFLGGDRESCHANTVQMPVREFIGGSQPEEEESVLSLLKDLREEALQQIKKSKMSRSKVILALRQCLNSVKSHEEEESGMNAMSWDESKYRNRMEDGKVKVNGWCDNLKEN